MPRPNTIDLLPADIRERVNAWLNDVSVTQLEAVARTNALVDAINEMRPDGEQLPNISKSGMNRYAQRMGKIGEKMRQTRQISEQIIGQLGNAPAGEVGKLINESIRTIVFDAVTGLAESDDPVSPGVINKLALAAKRLEEATTINERREKQIRDEQQRADAQRLAELERADAKTGKRTLDPETLRRIRQEVYGIVEAGE